MIPRRRPSSLHAPQFGAGSVDVELPLLGQQCERPQGPDTGPSTRPGVRRRRRLCVHRSDGMEPPWGPVNRCRQSDMRLNQYMTVRRRESSAGVIVRSDDKAATTSHKRRRCRANSSRQGFSNDLTDQATDREIPNKMPWDWCRPPDGAPYDGQIQEVNSRRHPVV